MKTPAIVKALFVCFLIVAIGSCKKDEESKSVPQGIIGNYSGSLKLEWVDGSGPHTSNYTRTVRIEALNNTSVTMVEYNSFGDYNSLIIDCDGSDLTIHQQLYTFPTGASGNFTGTGSYVDDILIINGQWNLSGIVHTVTYNLSK